MWKIQREPNVLEAEVRLGDCLVCRARNISKVPLRILIFEKLHSPECLFYKTTEGCKFGSVLMHTAGLMNSLAKGPQRTATKVLWQDMEPSRSSSILRKRTNILKPIRCVQFSKAYCVTPTFETKNHRSTKFAQVIHISAIPTLQNLRIGLRNRRNGKGDVHVKQRGGWPNISWNYRRNINLPSSHLPRIGVSLHPLQLNRRNENLS